MIPFIDLFHFHQKKERVEIEKRQNKISIYNDYSGSVPCVFKNFARFN